MKRDGNRDSTVQARQEARSAGLHWVTDAHLGLTRRRRGRGFAYLDAAGRVVRSPATLQRIRALVIPPAWRDVWISPDPHGHLQATGRDARGRKQYRYHARWRETRDASKFCRLISFAKCLPRIRRHVGRHLKLRGLPRLKVLATVVRLLETTLIRVGNEEYARSNHSFGLTTLQDRHVKIRGKQVVFRFSGKSGVDHDIELDEPRIARIIRKCQELPGQELLQYIDDEGQVRDIGSADVNDYLREISGSDFTAKDFRTWAGTVLAAQALQEFEDFDSQAAAKRNITRAIESVAARLGNTTAVSRKCYIHPAIPAAYMDRTLMKLLKQRTETELRDRLNRITAEEAAVLALLQQRMERDLKSPVQRPSKTARRRAVARRRGTGPRGA